MISCHWGAHNEAIGGRCHWLRLGSFLISATNRPPLFSERQGITKWFPVGFGWRIRVVKENQ